MSSGRRGQKAPVRARRRRALRPGLEIEARVQHLASELVKRRSLAGHSVVLECLDRDAEHFRCLVRAEEGSLVELSDPLIVPGPRRERSREPVGRDRDVACQQPRDAGALELVGETVHPRSHPLDDVQRRRCPLSQVPDERGLADRLGSQDGRPGPDPGGNQERLDLAPEPRADGSDVHEPKHAIGRIESRRVATVQGRDEARLGERTLAQFLPLHPGAVEIVGDHAPKLGIEHGHRGNPRSWIEKSCRPIRREWPSHRSSRRRVRRQAAGAPAASNPARHHGPRHPEREPAG